MMAAEAAQPGPLVELERILALEDGLPHERVPVDDYFEDYLHGLTAMAAQQGAAATTHRSSDGPCPSDSCTPPSSAAGTATAVAIAAGGGSAGMPPPQLLHPQAVQRGVPQQAQQGMAWPVQLAPGGMPPVGVPQMHPQLGMVQLVPVAAGMPLGMMAHMAKQPARHHTNGQNGKPKASSQRQATNREAQKRYRERQKVRLLEMQVEIDRLTRELAARQGAQRRNAELEEQHFQLQAQLARVEGEAEVLHWQAGQAAREHAQLAGMVAANGAGGQHDAAGAGPMDADTPGGGQPAGSSGQGPRQHGMGQQPQPQASLDSSEAGSAVGVAAQQHNNSVGALAAAADGAAAAAADKDCHASSQLPEGVAAAALAEVLVPVEQGGPAGHPAMYGAPPPHEKFDELLARFQAQVAKVKGFLDQHHLRTHDPISAVLSTSTRGDLCMLIMESLGICRELLRVEGVDVIHMLQQRDEEEMARHGTLHGSPVRQKWLHTIHTLHLTPQQKQQLLLQRQAHLALMRRIYQQRQQLNMQAMSIMLLNQQSAAAAAADPASADKVAGAGGQAAKLVTVLKLVKDNLRREQRAAMEINSCTLCRILSPVQAALYVCEAFPLHCDALAMCNVLSTIGQPECKATQSGAGSAGTPGNSSPLSSLG